MSRSLQEMYSPKSTCFGCGPLNEKGMRIRSMASGKPAASGIGEEITATFTPEKHHEAFEGMVSGGVIGTLLDCHCNWTAAYHLMKQAGLDQPPCTVTADYAIKLHRPTPSQGPLELASRVVELKADRATIEGTITVGGKVCASCRGTFVAVKPGHPAYHRW